MTQPFFQVMTKRSHTTSLFKLLSSLLLRQQQGKFYLKENRKTPSENSLFSSTVKIHLVVNVSRIQHYVGQVEGQRKEQPAPVIIEGEEEWEVERILNKQKIRGKDKYLVQ